MGVRMGCDLSIFLFYFLFLFFEKIKSDLTMLVLLSCAKTMSETSKVKIPLKTVPRFQKEASGIALQMSPACFTV